MDEDHCRLLAEADAELPPIIVHRRSNIVIDGLHRVRAAVIRGCRTIEARFLDGAVEDAFVMGVRMNIGHGMPLSRTDRSAAAERIITSYPSWSNRMVASTTGLSAGTVAGLRRRSSDQPEQSIVRIGKDGRARPIDGSSGRLRVQELLENNPDDTIRVTASKAGVSVSTVHDVRKRLQAGQGPLPPRWQDDQAPAVPAPFRPPALPHRGDRAEAALVVATLARDPMVRYSDMGRRLIRWLEGCRQGFNESREIAKRVPPYSIDHVAQLARDYSDGWARFADHLEQREY